MSRMLPPCRRNNRREYKYRYEHPLADGLRFCSWSYKHRLLADGGSTGRTSSPIVRCRSSIAIRRRAAGLHGGDAEIRLRPGRRTGGKSQQYPCIQRCHAALSAVTQMCGGRRCFRISQIKILLPSLRCRLGIWNIFRKLAIYCQLRDQKNR